MPRKCTHHPKIASIQNQPEIVVVSHFPLIGVKGASYELNKSRKVTGRGPAQKAWHGDCPGDR